MTDPDTKKIKTDEGDRFQSIDGKLYKTRSGAWKRNQKLKDKGLIDEQESLQPNEVTEISIEEKASEERQKPEWRKHDFTYEENQQIIPATLKSIKRFDPKRKRTAKEEKAERETAISTLAVLYRGSDILLSKYGKVVTENKEFIVTHSDQDYQWISSVTNEAFEENGIYIAALASPTMVAMASNAYWFGKPILEINSKRKRSLFKGGRIKNLFSKFKLRRKKSGRRNSENVE
tara:strand:- start:620 stop:1318 length:699 start_codon:yes stop_codon:yes gene_type:complete